MSKVNYLNLGCGATYHKDWTNVDFVSTGEGVIAHNLLAGVPFKDKTFEVVYHSHVLEHFPKDKAIEFIKECYRVLKKDGIIRIAIPDLERIARNYLKYLEESLNNVPKAAEKYEWSLLEMYDQVVRTQEGGGMISFIKDETKQIDDFLLEQNGHEVKLLMDNLRVKHALVNDSPATKAAFSINLKNRIKEKLKRMLLKDDYPKLGVAQFRNGGEIHQWMYDRYSLKLLLQNSGFSNVKVVTAFTSSIKDWDRFELDGKNGLVRKPDSLFIEAKK
jgi:predicted SAM-dependent methyltransferase